MADEDDDAAEPDRETAYLTTKQLADRWRVNAQTLTNQRFRGEGIPWTKPSGKPLYNLADVLAAEKAGRSGFTWHGLGDALARVLRLPREEAMKLVDRIKRAMR